MLDNILIKTHPDFPLQPTFEEDKAQELEA
jgi:hypothetical protein